MITVKNLIDSKRFEQALNEAEKTVYLAAYEAAGRNQVKAARALGVSRGTFRTKLKSWGVKMPREYEV